MPRRKPANGQLSLLERLADALPADPYATRAARPAPAEPEPFEEPSAEPVEPAPPPKLQATGEKAAAPEKPAPRPAARKAERPAPPASAPKLARPSAKSARSAAMPLPGPSAPPPAAAATRPDTPARRTPRPAAPATPAQRLAALYDSGRVQHEGAPMSLVADVSYRNYAVAVVTDRAVPDVRDGLKPVQRRILYDMLVELGLDSRGPHKKSARIVGDVLGKFHPHGDQAVYDAMARMAQDFTMRLPLVDGQGNFGSADGDAPAAMRYTEARLSRAGEAMLADIRSDTVDFTDNFDGSLQEPTVLPTPIPNLLVNGANGIAVGMASNIPPHNLGEVCDAVVFVARNWARRSAISPDQLMRFIPGPDFPTGGLVYRYRPDPKTGEPVDVIRQAYATGRSTLVVSATSAVEDIGGGKAEIAVTEIPYQVTRSTVKDRVADERERFRAAGVSAVSDLSDRHGMRLVFETVRGFEPEAVLRYLLDNTRLSNSLPYGAVVLVRNERGELEPRQCRLDEILIQFVAFRLDVIVRRSRFELKRAEDRLHLVLGLLKAIADIDEVIRIIRGSADADEARRRLMKRLAIDEIQATAILDMQLRRLARLEFKKLDDERKELEARIRELRGILESEKRQLDIVVRETEAVQAQFATPRRTRIVDDEAGHKSAAPITGPAASEGPQLVVVSPEAARCLPPAAAEKVPAGKPSAKPVEVALARFTAGPDEALLIVTSTGRLWKGSPARLAAGLSLASGESLVFGAVAAPDQCLVLGTRRGNVKRMRVADVLGRPDNAWGVAIGLEDEGDAVLFAGQGGEDAHVFFCTAGAVEADARALRFEAGQVNPQATPSARGVAGIKLMEGDVLAGGGVLAPSPDSQVLVLSQGGCLKRVPLAEFPVQGRGGQGVVALKVTAATGPVAAFGLAGPGGCVDIYSARGRRLRLPLADVEAARRPSPGLSLHKAYGGGSPLFGGEPLARLVVAPAS